MLIKAWKTDSDDDSKDYDEYRSFPGKSTFPSTYDMLTIIDSDSTILVDFNQNGIIGPTTAYIIVAEDGVPRSRKVIENLNRIYSGMIKNFKHVNIVEAYNKCLPKLAKTNVDVIPIGRSEELGINFEVVVDNQDYSFQSILMTKTLNFRNISTRFKAWISDCQKMHGFASHRQESLSDFNKFRSIMTNCTKSYIPRTFTKSQFTKLRGFLNKLDIKLLVSKINEELPSEYMEIYDDIVNLSKHNISFTIDGIKVSSGVPASFSILGKTFQIDPSNPIAVKFIFGLFEMNGQIQTLKNHIERAKLIHN